MNTIVLHAGMPKTGSSSIQAWLEENGAYLRERGFTVVSAPRLESTEIRLGPHQAGQPINSGWIADRVEGTPERKQTALIDAFVDALASAADRHGAIVLSGESFAHGFWSVHEPTLKVLEQLARSYEVRVAYYARPQDSALEAGWRQGGYRSRTAPRAWVEQHAGRFHYAATRRAVVAVAPSLGFEPRPFREDLFVSGDLVSDFAAQFLGIDIEPVGRRINRGLPLEVVNVLQAAPADSFWDPRLGNRRNDRIKRLIGSDRLPRDDRVELSRLVLRKFSNERFGAENAELGWRDFVSPLGDDAGDVPGLAALNWLWTPRASPAELTLLFRALQVAIEPSTEERHRSECKLQGDL